MEGISRGARGFPCCFVNREERGGRAARGAQPLLDTGESPQHGSRRTHLEETRLHRFHGSRNGVFHFASGRERRRKNSLQSKERGSTFRLPAAAAKQKVLEKKRAKKKKSTFQKKKRRTRPFLAAGARGCFWPVLKTNKGTHKNSKITGKNPREPTRKKKQKTASGTSPSVQPSGSSPSSVGDADEIRSQPCQ